MPPIVREIADGRRITAIWVNDLGGVTYRLGDDEVIKWFRGEHWEIDLPAEAGRLRWVSAYLPVPEVIDVGSNGTDHWLRTRAIPAESAAHPSNATDPARTVPAVARGLRRWHDALPVADCPYQWDVASRIASRPNAALLADAPSLLAAASRMETDLVVCRGDACAPNFLVRNAEVVGYVDLGHVGVGDRWADLAPAMMSLEWNYGTGWDRSFVDSYEIEFDPERFDYYRRLWDLA